MSSVAESVGRKGGSKINYQSESSIKGSVNYSDGERGPVQAIIDSGANRHCITTMQERKNVRQRKYALDTVGGTVSCEEIADASIGGYEIKDAWVIDDNETNIISESRFIKQMKGFIATDEYEKLHVKVEKGISMREALKDCKGIIIDELATVCGGLYVLLDPNEKGKVMAARAKLKTLTPSQRERIIHEAMRIHRLLNHKPLPAMKRMLRNGDYKANITASEMDTIASLGCDICELKNFKERHHKRKQKVNEPLLHIDVAGPFKSMSASQKLEKKREARAYGDMVEIAEEAVVTGWDLINPTTQSKNLTVDIRIKNSQANFNDLWTFPRANSVTGTVVECVETVLTRYKMYFERGIMRKRVRRLRFDNAPYFHAKGIKEMCTRWGCVPEYTTPHEHQQLQSEEQNYVIDTAVRAKLAETCLPLHFWPSAERELTKLRRAMNAHLNVDGKSTYEKIYGKPIDLRTRGLYGESAVIKDRKDTSKHELQGVRAINLGHTPWMSKCNIFYVPFYETLVVASAAKWRGNLDDAKPDRIAKFKAVKGGNWEDGWNDIKFKKRIVMQNDESNQEAIIGEELGSEEKEVHFEIDGASGTELDLDNEDAIDDNAEMNDSVNEETEIREESTRTLRRSTRETKQPENYKDFSNKGIFAAKAKARAFLATAKSKGLSNAAEAENKGKYQRGSPEWSKPADLRRKIIEDGINIYGNCPFGPDKKNGYEKIAKGEPVGIVNPPYRASDLMRCVNSVLERFRNEPTSRMVMIVPLNNTKWRQTLEDGLREMRIPIYESRIRGRVKFYYHADEKRRTQRAPFDSILLFLNYGKQFSEMGYVLRTEDGETFQSTWIPAQARRANDMTLEEALKQRGHSRMPGSIYAAMKDPILAPFCREATREEWQKILNAEGFEYKVGHEVRDLLKVNIIWVYTLKRDAMGKPLCIRARAAADGRQQIEGVHFKLTELYSGVSGVTPVLTMLSLAMAREKEESEHGRKIHVRHADIAAAYIKCKQWSEGCEKVCWGVPFWCLDMAPNGERFALITSNVYGLKSSGHNYAKERDAYFIEIGLMQYRENTSLWKMQKDESWLWMGVYVDDLVATTNDLEMYKGVIELVELKWGKLKHDEDIDYLLSWRGTRHSRGLLLDVNPSVRIFLEKYDLGEVRLRHTPIAVGTKWEKYDGPAIDSKGEPKRPYRNILGSLSYFANTVAPEIIYSVRVLARFQSNPGPKHWDGLMRVCGYMRWRVEQESFGLNISNTSHEFVVNGCSDATHNTWFDSRSELGWFVRVHNTVVYAAASVQNAADTPATSSTESEWYAAYECSKVMMWIQHLVQFFQGESERAHLGIDNKSLVLMTESQTPRRQTRHVGLRHDFLFHRINNGNLVVEHIAGTVNVADFYTKPQTANRMRECCEYIQGMRWDEIREVLEGRDVGS